MSDAFVGLIRTWVPAGVGAALAWLITLGVELDPQTEAGLLTSLTALAIALYYTVIRLLEAKWPAVGVLLGVPKTAVYNMPPAESTSDAVYREDGSLSEVRSVTRWPEKPAE